MIKFSLGLIVLVVGGYFAVQKIPSLQANILTVVNPKLAQEQELLQQLDEQLKTVDLTRTKAAVVKAQDIVSEIKELNEEHGGVIEAAVSRVVEAILPKSPSSASPTPVPGSAASPAVSAVPCTP